MKYKFTIDEATEKPVKDSVEFNVKWENRAYTFVIRHILNFPGNEPIKQGTLYRETAFGWEEVMRWKRGPGWYFSKPKDNGMVDNRIAPGC
jgi:hypothetical protein